MTPAEVDALVEYYLVGDPPGLLMLKSNGEIWRLAVMSRGDMSNQAERARSFGAPDDLVGAVSEGRVVVFYTGSKPTDYFGDEGFPWDEHTHAARTLNGTTGDWTIAIWKDAPGDIDFDPTVSSYDAYLDSLS